MPENEFEKKVSSELGGLKFKPSEEVWLKVEERIRRKKKKRVFIIFFLLAGLALFGYWQRNLFFGEKNNDIVNVEEPAENKNSSGEVNETENAIRKAGIDSVKNKTENTETFINNETNEEEQVKTTEQEEIKGAKKTVEGTDERIRIEGKNKPADEGAEKTNSNGVKNKQTKGEKVNELTQRVVKKGKEEKTKVIDENKKKDDVLTDVTLPENIDKPISKDSIGLKEVKPDDVKDVVRQHDARPMENRIDSVKADTAAKKIDIKRTDSLKVQPIDSPVVSAPKRTIDKKWKLGIEFSPGISSLSNQLFSFSTMKSADLNYQSPTGGGSVSTPSTAGPSPHQVGFAFQVGGIINKQFTKKSSLSAGLRYAFYSSNMRIGANRLNPPNRLLDFLNQQSANVAYGAAGDTTNYTDRYHFIELPLYYNLRLNKNISHPLTLQVGFKLGRMIGSNALAYDTIAGGIYYRSDRYLNKTQFGLSAGLNWTIKSKENFQWTIGPVIDLHLNSLFDSPFESKRYIFFTGVRSAIRFNSKK